MTTATTTASAITAAMAVATTPIDMPITNPGIVSGGYCSGIE